MRRRGRIAVAGLALVLFLAPAALAEEGLNGHEVRTTPTSGPEHGGSPGADDGMTTDEKRGDAPAGEQHGSHGVAAAPPSKGRPRALVLASFAGFNALVLVAAAFLRRRDRRRPGPGVVA